MREEGAEVSEPLRILVVDDEPNITDLLAMALRYEAFEVAVADYGRKRPGGRGRRSALT